MGILKIGISDDIDKKRERERGKKEAKEKKKGTDTISRSRINHPDCLLKKINRLQIKPHEISFKMKRSKMGS